MVVKKATRPLIKRGIPNLSWTVTQLDNWWKRRGFTRTESNWSDAKDRFIETKVVSDIYDFEGIATDSSQFAHCCGVLEYGELWLQDDLADMSHEQLCAVASYDLLGSKFVCFVATTIQTQKREAAVLDAIGFNKVSTFKNPNSSNTVTLWHYTKK